jgi:hypothetical protein
MSRPVFRSSFYRQLDYRKQYWAHLVRKKGLDTEIYPEYSKLRGRALGESVGVPSPPLLAGPVGVADLNLDAYGDSFVIKPNWGTASRGVLVLERKGRNEFHELIEDVHLSAEQLLEAVAQKVSTSGRGSATDLIVEKSMANGSLRPQEWKIFSFYGEIGLVQQMDRSGDTTSLKLYRPDGGDAGKLRSDVKFAPSLPQPGQLENLLEAARKISLAIPTGFVRVDLFEQGDSVVLGELCLIPGGDLYFRKGWDKRLGDMWNQANVRILQSQIPLIP